MLRVAKENCLYNFATQLLVTVGKSQHHTAIRVSPEIHDRIFSYAEELGNATGQPVKAGDVVALLLERYQEAVKEEPHDRRRRVRRTGRPPVFYTEDALEREHKETRTQRRERRTVREGMAAIRKRREARKE
jgi:hypothetical protein